MSISASVFNQIPENELVPLLRTLQAVEKNFFKGETILFEDEVTDRLGVILSGSALVEYHDAWGNRRLFGYVRQGEVFAEAYACLREEKLMTCVVAAEKTTVLFLCLTPLLNTEAPSKAEWQLMKNLLTVGAGKSLQLSRRILHTSPKTIRERLMSFFSECMRKNGSRAFDIPYNRQQLADFLGVDRSAMCKELSKMQKEQLISFNKNHFFMC